MDRRCGLTPRRRNMRRRPAFRPRRVPLIAHRSRRLRLLGTLNLLMAGERYRIIRKHAEHGEGEEASQRPKALVHPVAPREPTGTNNEIARSVPFELHGEYHTA